MEFQQPPHYHTKAPAIGSSPLFNHIIKTASEEEGNLRFRMDQLEDPVTSSPIVLSMSPRGITRQQHTATAAAVGRGRNRNEPLEPVTPSFGRRHLSKRDCVDKTVPCCQPDMNADVHLLRMQGKARDYICEHHQHHHHQQQHSKIQSQRRPQQEDHIPQQPPSYATTSSKPKKNNLRKEISASPSSRHLMRQVSGLGMEDPVFGEGTDERDQNCATQSHPSQIFDDMSINDIPEDMRDMISIASDPTATQDDTGLDTQAFSKTLAHLEEFGFKDIRIPSTAAAAAAVTMTTTTATCPESHNSVSSATTALSSSVASPSLFNNNNRGATLPRKVLGTSNSSLGRISDHSARSRQSNSTFGPMFSTGNLSTWDVNGGGPAITPNIAGSSGLGIISEEQQQQQQHKRDIPMSSAAASSSQEIPSLASSLSEKQQPQPDIAFRASEEPQEEVRLSSSNGEPEMSLDEQHDRVFGGPSTVTKPQDVSATAETSLSTDVQEISLVGNEEMQILSSTSSGESQREIPFTPDMSAGAKSIKATSTTTNNKSLSSHRHKLTAAAHRAMPALRSIFPETAQLPAAAAAKSEKRSSPQKTKSRRRNRSLRLLSRKPSTKSASSKNSLW